MFVDKEEKKEKNWKQRQKGIRGKERKVKGEKWISIIQGNPELRI